MWSLGPRARHEGSQFPELLTHVTNRTISSQVLSRCLQEKLSGLQAAVTVSRVSCGFPHPGQRFCGAWTLSTNSDRQEGAWEEDGRDWKDFLKAQSLPRRHFLPKGLGFSMDG